MLNEKGEVTSSPITVGMAEAMVAVYGMPNGIYSTSSDMNSEGEKVSVEIHGSTGTQHVSNLRVKLYKNGKYQNSASVSASVNINASFSASGKLICSGSIDAVNLM